MSAVSPIETQNVPAAIGWAREGRQPAIAIVGAGMSGIAAVVKLRRAGYTDLTVYEKADRVGGTWRENRYPGLSCDIPSYWYSFTFAPNPDWSHRFSYGPEIQAYMESTAERFGVDEVIRFDTPVTELTYEAPRWRLKTAGGEERMFDVVISATGVLHHPVLPKIEGLERFAGPAFHSARWDDSVELAGKRVGVIGTGSTSCQIVGAIAEQVEHLSVFQRTPHWMVPMPQKAYARWWKGLLRLFPFLHFLLFNFYYRLMERGFGKLVIGDRKAQARLDGFCRKYIDSAIEDPELRAKVTPDYQAACKRLILCSTYYPALNRDNVSLITDGIERIDGTGVVTVDGEHHDLDVLVFATGFDAAAFVLPTRVTGEDGRDLEQLWDGAPRAHRSVALPGFPNFWMLEGPTGPVGNLSLITVSELEVGYVIKCLDEMRKRGADAMAPSQEAFEAYNTAIAAALPQTVWVTGGCDSWYLDKSGLPNLYPFHTRRFRHEMLNPDFSEYRHIKQADAATG